jgi:hypothetical protein
LRLGRDTNKHNVFQERFCGLHAAGFALDAIIILTLLSGKYEVNPLRPLFPFPASRRECFTDGFSPPPSLCGPWRVSFLVGFFVCMSTWNARARVLLKFGHERPSVAAGCEQFCTKPNTQRFGTKERFTPEKLEHQRRMFI